MFVHVDGSGIRRSDKEVHKVAIMHLGGGVLQDLHELLCQPLSPAQARCNLWLAAATDICCSSALQQSAGGQALQQHPGACKSPGACRDIHHCISWPAWSSIPFHVCCTQRPVHQRPEAAAHKSRTQKLLHTEVAHGCFTQQPTHQTPGYRLPHAEVAQGGCLQKTHHPTAAHRACHIQKQPTKVAAYGDGQKQRPLTEATAHGAHLYSGATVTAVTWPCQLGPVPSALPRMYPMLRCPGPSAMRQYSGQLAR